MTKYFFRLLLLIGTPIAFLAVLGSILPRNYEFASEIQIAEPPDVVFTEVNQLSNWQSWSQWNPAEIPGLSVQYSGPASGVGSVQTWTDIRGSGKLWITKSETPDLIEYEMIFANFPKLVGQIMVTKKDSGSVVRWSSHGKLPSGPFYGFFAPFFSTQMSGEYEKSLLKLQSKLEQRSTHKQVGEQQPVTHQ